MSAFNLIPIPRQEARTRRRLIRAWIAATTLSAAGVGAVTLVTIANAGVETSAANELVSAAQQQVEQARGREQGLRTRALSTKRAVQAAQAVGKPPNWNILLALLAKARGPEVENRVLKIEMPEDAVPETVKVEVSGEAASQAAVSNYVLSLEASELFANVSLGRSDLQESGRVGFQLTGTILGLAPTAPETTAGSATASKPATGVATGQEIPR